MSKIADVLIELEIVFKGIAGQYTHCQDRINDSVQMLYEYFLNMNQDTLKSIYEKDGKEGIIKYSALTLDLFVRNTLLYSFLPLKKTGFTLHIQSITTI